jgi:hypothetical protein
VNFDLAMLDFLRARDDLSQPFALNSRRYPIIDFHTFPREV